SQRNHLLLVYFGVVAKAAFHRTAAVVVLDAVADEGVDLTGVQLDWHLHFHFAQRGCQQRFDSRTDVHHPRRLAKVMVGSIGRLHGSPLASAIRTEILANGMS